MTMPTYIYNPVNSNARMCMYGPGIGEPWVTPIHNNPIALDDRIHALMSSYDADEVRAAIERNVTTTRADDDEILTLGAMRPVLVRAKT